MLRAAWKAFFLSGLLFPRTASAQCTSPFSLGPDVTLCAGQTLLLTVPPIYQSYLWNTGATTSTLLVTGPGTYSCTTGVVAPTGNLVVNGDFSAGATGFSSDYIPGVTGPWGPLSDPGTYGVTTSPSLVHTQFASFGDHTTGLGGMLVVNGASTVNQNVWCQTVAVDPYTDYAFSAWLASCVTGSPAQLQFTVNGMAVGNLNALAMTGVWTNFYSVWNSGASSTATICITNLNTSMGGNDFALDDIVFAPFCVYYDEVVVNYLANPVPELGPDASFCADATVTLDPAWPTASNYLWSTGSTAPTLVANSPGWYWVEVTEDGCTARDSILLTMLPLPVADLGADQTSCAGQTVILDATYPGASYVWLDGSTAPTLNATLSGNYHVTLSLSGCTDKDTVYVHFHPLPVVELGPDSSLCAGEFLALDVYRPGGSYLWNDGTVVPQRNVQGGATYTVTVTENGCSTMDAIAVGVTPLPEVDLGDDFDLCVGSIAFLDAEGPGYTYAWSDGSAVPDLTISEPGTYWVEVSNACGLATDTILVTPVFCDCPVYVPVAFTPNGDGNNEWFRPISECTFRSYHLRIFDRWGALVWETKKPEEAWRGVDELSSVFVWTLEFVPDGITDTQRELRGHVVVLR